eukprot:m51a1_g14319 hypothetical protein (256) ;mRNA; f:20806-23992
MRDTAQSVSKESIMKAGVKQAQAGEKQKKMKESTLDTKKIKVTSELNVAVIESKEVLFSKFFKSQNNCKKVTLIASKLMTWKPEDMQKLFHEISKIEEIDKIPSTAIMWGKLTKESEITAALKNMEKNSILSEKPVMVNWNKLVYPAKAMVAEAAAAASDSGGNPAVHGVEPVSTPPFMDESKASDSDKDEPAAAAAVTDDLSITKGKSPSKTKKQKPKASTASAVISPTLQSHAELETARRARDQFSHETTDSA